MFYVYKAEDSILLISSAIVNNRMIDVNGREYTQRNYIFELVDKYVSYNDIVSEYGYEVPELPYEIDNIDMLVKLGHLVTHKDLYPEEDFQMELPEKYFIVEVLEEDLEVAEKWLIRVSVLEKRESEDEVEELISRKLVFELIAKLADDYKEALKWDFEVAKLPILYLTDTQKKLLMANGKFELDVFDHVRRPKEVKRA